MAIAIRGTPTTVVDGAGATSFTINVPTGVVNGDLLVLFGSCDSPGTLTKPAAFTAGPVNATNFDFGAMNFKRGNFWYRVASSEPASYTITKDTFDSAVIMVAYSGVDNVTPMDANDVTFVGSTTASPDTASVTGITTVTDGAMIVIGIVPDKGVVTTSSTLTTSSGMTIEGHATGTAVAEAWVADVIQATHGASGTKSFTLTQTGVNFTMFAYTVALRPASGGVVDEDYYRQGRPQASDPVVTVFS